MIQISIDGFITAALVSTNLITCIVTYIAVSWWRDVGRGRLKNLAEYLRERKE